MNGFDPGVPATSLQGEVAVTFPGMTMSSRDEARANRWIDQTVTATASLEVALAECAVACAGSLSADLFLVQSVRNGFWFQLACLRTATARVFGHDSAVAAAFAQWLRRLGRIRSRQSDRLQSVLWDPRGAESQAELRAEIDRIYAECLEAKRWAHRIEHAVKGSVGTEGYHLAQRQHVRASTAVGKA